MFDKWHRFFMKQASSDKENATSELNKLKSYLIIASSEPGGDLNITSLLAGELNRLYVHGENYKIYNNLDDLLANSKSLVRGKSHNGVYILVSPYPLDDVIDAASKGLLNEKIQKAFNYRDTVNNGGSVAITEEKIAGIENSHFTGNKVTNGQTPAI